MTMASKAKTPTRLQEKRELGSLNSRLEAYGEQKIQDLVITLATQHCVVSRRQFP